MADVSPAAEPRTGKTAFVLAGGGNLGATQVGMLQALLESGIAPDVIVGSSVGALNGAFLAGQPDLARTESLAKLWTGIRRQDIFPFTLGRLVSGALGRRNHFFDPHQFQTFIRKVPLGFRLLEEAAVPLHVMATDLLSGDAVLLSSGLAIDALLASSAIPGVFPPVVIDGRRLIDGGVAANVPVAQAEALGADEIWVLPTAPGFALPAETAPDLMLHAMQKATGPREAAALAEVSARVAVHVVPVPTGSQPSMFDFTQTGVLMTRALAATRQWLGHPPLLPHTASC
ncbi:MAG TPA: patatin-like phospholipase family protein [Acidimicrobiales bacterium]|nr:patatin-like phospholipase family protein [Acidimicrobiales bacterium]